MKLTTVLVRWFPSNDSHAMRAKKSSIMHVTEAGNEILNLWNIESTPKHAARVIVRPRGT